jgi:hypothetical protein
LTTPLSSPPLLDPKPLSSELVTLHDEPNPEEHVLPESSPPLLLLPLVVPFGSRPGFVPPQLAHHTTPMRVIASAPLA